MKCIQRSIRSINFLKGCSLQAKLILILSYLVTMIFQTTQCHLDVVRIVLPRLPGAPDVFLVTLNNGGHWSNGMHNVSLWFVIYKLKWARENLKGFCCKNKLNKRKSVLLLEKGKGGFNSSSDMALRPINDLRSAELKASQLSQVGLKNPAGNGKPLNLQQFDPSRAESNPCEKQVLWKFLLSDSQGILLQATQIKTENISVPPLPLAAGDNE